MKYELQIEAIIIKAYLDGVQRGLKLSKAIMRGDELGEGVIRQEVEAVMNAKWRGNDR